MFLKNEPDPSTLRDLKIIFDYDNFMEIIHDWSPYFARLTLNVGYKYTCYSETFGDAIMQQYKEHYAILETITKADKAYLIKVVDAHRSSKISEQDGMKEMFKYFKDKYGDINPTRYCYGKVNIEKELNEMKKVKSFLELMQYGAEGVTYYE